MKLKIECSTVSLCMIVGLCCVQSLSTSDSKIWNNKLKMDEKVLSRHRRYLVFPEGSSLQLVYDQIIGMIGSTNLHIFGVTCSLAWQLPHDTLLTKEKASNAKVSNTKGNKTVDRVDIPLEKAENVSRYHHNVYYKPTNYHNHIIDANYYEYLKHKTKLNRYYFDSVSNNRQWNYNNHQIYPALRMRRSFIGHSDDQHPNVKPFLEHHRNSRFDFYKSIERYLNANGVNGEQCIKRAICETTLIEMNNKNNNENEPEYFLKEIFRVIFSLPVGGDHKHTETVNNKYDSVMSHINAVANIDCSKIYQACSASIWNINF